MSAIDKYAIMMISLINLSVDKVRCQYCCTSRFFALSSNWLIIRLIVCFSYSPRILSPRLITLRVSHTPRFLSPLGASSDLFHSLLITRGSWSASQASYQGRFIMAQSTVVDHDNYISASATRRLLFRLLLFFPATRGIIKQPRHLFGPWFKWPDNTPVSCSPASGRPPTTRWPADGVSPGHCSLDAACFSPDSVSSPAHLTLADSSCSPVFVSTPAACDRWSPTPPAVCLAALILLWTRGLPILSIAPRVTGCGSTTPSCTSSSLHGFTRWKQLVYPIKRAERSTHLYLCSTLPTLL